MFLLGWLMVESGLESNVDFIPIILCFFFFVEEVFFFVLFFSSVLFVSSFSFLFFPSLIMTAPNITKSPSFVVIRNPFRTLFFTQHIYIIYLSTTLT